VWTAALAISAVLYGAPVPVKAQIGGPGFTFRQPTLSFAFHAGYARPFARSDLFDQTMDEVFLDRNDLQSPYLGGELAFRASDRLDVALEVGHSWSRTTTEWQDFTEDNGNPLWHTVSFSRTPVTMTAKYYLTDRGRRIGQFVWIPARVVPFVSVGAGVVRYRFAREGDFVQEPSLIIYTDNLEQVGSAFTAHGSFGLDIGLTKGVYVTPQARYSWARGGLDRSIYSEFQPLDLSGFQLTLGIGARF
jgi:hypothetical protein